MTDSSEETKIAVAEYAFKLKAQAWRRDSYYVGSSQEIKFLTVIGSTEDEAKDEARRVLGKIDSAWYWRFWVVSAGDVRLASAKETTDA